MNLYKYILTQVLKSITLFFVLISFAQASNIKNSATVFMYHKFGVSKYPSTSVTIDQLESHINEILKETTEQNYTLDIYISECKHDETTPEEWVKEKTHKFEVVFHFNNVPNPNYGFSYYIDTIMDSYWGNTGGLCLYGHKYDYASVSEEVMDRVRAFIQRFVDANNLNLHKENR